MRIGITCYPTYGGSGIVATELGLELARRGHEIHFITYANPIRLDAATGRIHYHEVEVATYPLFQYPPYTLALASRMAEVAERYSLDILHVHYAIPHSISAYLARGILASNGIRIPIATTLHGTDITLVGTDRSYFLITKFAIEQSDGVTAVSHYLSNQMRDVFGIEKPVRVIYNSVNLEHYKIRPHQNREPVLIHVSNFRPVKRVLDCVRVLAILRKRIPVRLRMIGDGPDRGPAERLAHELGVSEYVDFPGKCHDIAETVGGADVLLPRVSRISGPPPSSRSVWRLIISTKVRMPEVLTDGVNGFLCEVGDVESMAARAYDILTDTQLRSRLVEAGRKTAETRFSTEIIIPEYEAFYEELIEQAASQKQLACIR
ncbi:MAG: N-acetyl-alpha-D-glucosaminyl L-malate synthase BshA [Bryobacterales bacterium]|nr:N-acetyl-alpha-D-glucosaminyl L-malate synthase BshA [Bryobacterales bacterium]